jgi:hypothetical protein
MPPLSLSDQELEIVMRAAGPLPAQDRSRFLEAVIAELAHYSRDEIGEGSIARVAHTLQRQFGIRPRSSCTPRRNIAAARFGNADKKNGSQRGSRFGVAISIDCAPRSCSGITV